MSRDFYGSKSKTTKQKMNIELLRFPTRQSTTSTGSAAPPTKSKKEEYLYHKPPVRASTAVVCADDLLPENTSHLWSQILMFSTSSAIRLSGSVALGLLALRETCRLFAQLCPELIEEIDVNIEKSKSSRHKALTHVLLLRPLRLKSFSLSSFIETLPPPDFVANLFRRLAKATEIKKIYLSYWSMLVEGSRLRKVGEKCTKLESLEMSVKFIQDRFDSPTAFRVLEKLELECHLLERLTKKKRESIEAPDFRNFPRLASVENVLWNTNAAISLSNASKLTSIKENHNATPSCDLMLAFAKASDGKPICTSLKCLDVVEDGELSEYSFSDDTGMALLNSFPLLQTLKIQGTGIELGIPFLKKLKRMKHLVELHCTENTQWGPSESWLHDSCKLFPKSLRKLFLTEWKWQHVDLDEDEYDYEAEEDQDEYECEKETRRESYEYEIAEKFQEHLTQLEDFDFATTQAHEEEEWGYPYVHGFY